MTNVEAPDYDDLREQVESLLTKAKEALESDERASSLASTIPVLDESRIRIALAGPHNAGKSTLIAALLKLPPEQVEQITAAIPTTAATTPYEWHGHVLLDLPGTLSGLGEHDDEAAAGVRRADLLLLVTSVELPGEAETLQINTLLADEGFAHRALVVINKCNSEESDPDVVRAEMRTRLASHPQIEMFFADAQDFVDSQNFPGLDDDDRDRMREESGIDAVEAALNALAVECGRTARLQALCHEVRRTSLEASTLWDADGGEDALETSADRIRFALENARTELTDTTDLSLTTLECSISAIGTSLALSVSEQDGSVDSKSADHANASREKALTQYGESLNHALHDVLSRLDGQLGTAVADWERYAVGAGLHPPQTRPSVQRRNDKTDDAIGEMADSVVREGRRKLEAFIKEGTRPGTPAHTAARKLRSALKMENKPHSISNTAKKLTKAGKFTGNAANFLSPVLDAKEIIDNVLRSHAINKRRAEIRDDYRDHARDLIGAERTAVDEHVAGLLRVREEAVAETLVAADENASTRMHAQAQWDAISKQAQQLAATIDLTLVS